MFIKRSLKFFLLRIFYDLRNIKWMFWLPLIMLNLMIPLINYHTYRTNYPESVTVIPGDLHEVMLIAAPLLSVWWLLFVMREYVEGEGCEVLYVCRAHNKLPEALGVFMLYIADICILYIFYIRFEDKMKLSLCMLLCVCVMMFGLVYLLLQVTRTMTVPLLAVMMYCMASILFVKTKDVFLLYNIRAIPTWEIIKSNYSPMLIVGFVFLLLGILVSRKRVPVK